ISGDAHDGRRKIVRAVNHPVEGRELVLADADLTSDGRQGRLNQLLHRCFSAPHGDDVECRAVSRQEASGRIRIEGDGRDGDVPGELRRARSVRYATEGGEHAVHEGAAGDGERQGEAYLRVIEWGPPHVEDQSIRKDQRVLEHLEPRILADKGDVNGRDAGQVELAAREGSQLGGGL